MIPEPKQVRDDLSYRHGPAFIVIFREKSAKTMHR